MQMLQRRQVVGFTFAACLMLIIAGANFVSGEYREMPAWRVVLQATLGLGALWLLWEIWKPGGAARPGRSEQR